MSIITLTTDYGVKDHFVGALKGKILTEFPEAHIVDISHSIDPFNIAEASYIIGAAYSSFPKGTVHLIGVDIEINKDTPQHLVMQWNDHFFICADNGILSILTQKIVPQKIVSINIHDRLPIDATELDVFKTVAIHVAKGGLLNVVGKEIKSIKEITDLKPVISNNQLKGYIIYIDHYGNAVSNITKKMFLEHSKGRPYEVRFKNKNLKTILAKYSEVVLNKNRSLKDCEGEKLAIFNDADFLEIALYKSNPDKVGSASTLLGLNYRDVVTIEFF
jgi:S-adenosylmethionine hydrolase